jgi:hypothetical protein
MYNHRDSPQNNLLHYFPNELLDLLATDKTLHGAATKIKVVKTDIQTAAALA